MGCCGPKASNISVITNAIFPTRHTQKSSQHVRACATGDGAICYKNRKIVSYHGDSLNRRISARLRSPSLIMAPAWVSGLYGGFTLSSNRQSLDCINILTPKIYSCCSVLVYLNVIHFPSNIAALQFKCILNPYTHS